MFSLLSKVSRVMQKLQSLKEQGRHKYLFMFDIVLHNPREYCFLLIFKEKLNIPSCISFFKDNDLCITPDVSDTMETNIYCTIICKS